LSSINDPKITFVRMKLSLSDARGKIPTSFLSLSPDRLIVEENIDVLVGVFHIMWDDMPRRRTYQIRLQDLVSKSGDYFGTSLKCGTSKDDVLQQLD
jgi:hypothetical protein